MLSRSKQGKTTIILRLILIMCLTASVAVSQVFAQQMEDVVYLKNGGVVRGTIVEQIPGESLKIQTRDGNVLVFTMDEIDKLSKDIPKVPKEPVMGVFGVDIPSSASADPKKSTGIGLSLGVIVQSDENVFFGTRTDLYPEMTIYHENSNLRVGGTVGFIWRYRFGYKTDTYWNDDVIGWDVEYVEATITIIPIMTRLDVLISPIFLGIGVGYYASLEDGPPSQPAVALRFGADIISNSNITIILDVRYEHTFDEPQLGGIIATVGGNLKILD